MARRSTASEPPRGHGHKSDRHRQQETPPHRKRPLPQQECGFDWTPGVVLGLLGALAYLNYDFDKYRKNHDVDEREQRREKGEGEGAGSESGRGRRRHRSRGGHEDEGEDEYYSRGGGRRVSR
ncbi:hypothetical protein FZEAL_7813 [Fusarium zealandicum]|uniref:Uncharacterized protein n=1 Tax=Fusarium zealandicum TaxID=1053134 RepID=A0A8H4UFQ4_9HYPO|nr:hypothetical protein FZEAL_7813 [Fusarium zealandicum]